MLYVNTEIMIVKPGQAYPGGTGNGEICNIDTLFLMLTVQFRGFISPLELSTAPLPMSPFGGGEGAVLGIEPRVFVLSYIPSPFFICFKTGSKLPRLVSNL